MLRDSLSERRDSGDKILFLLSHKKHKFISMFALMNWGYNS